MNPEQRVSLEGIEVAVELDVVLIRELAGTLAPGGFPLVDGFALQLDLHRHEVAIGGDQRPDASRLDVFLFFLHQVEDHVRTRLGPLGGLEAEVG